MYTEDVGRHEDQQEQVHVPTKVVSVGHLKGAPLGLLEPRQAEVDHRSLAGACEE